MKTAEEIIAYLESKLAESYKLYNQTSGKDAQQALENILKVTIIEQILDEIK